MVIFQTRLRAGKSMRERERERESALFTTCQAPNFEPSESEKMPFHTQPSRACAREGREQRMFWRDILRTSGRTSGHTSGVLAKTCSPSLRAQERTSMTLFCGRPWPEEASDKRYARDFGLILRSLTSDYWVPMLHLGRRTERKRNSAGHPHFWTATIPWTCPVCPVEISHLSRRTSWMFRDLPPKPSLGHLRGIPTTKFLDHWEQKYCLPNLLSSDEIV